MKSVETTVNIFQIEGVADRLTCPVCQHKAIYKSSIVKCSNIDCLREFPVINNIPILINENECFLQDIFPQNCKSFFPKVASPFSAKLQTEPVRQNWTVT